MFRLINKQRNKKGFTLVELVVVIAILGILAAIAVPRLLGFQERARAQADNQVAAQVKNAVALLYANQEIVFTDDPEDAAVLPFEVTGDPSVWSVDKDHDDYDRGDLDTANATVASKIGSLINDATLQLATHIVVTIDAEGGVEALPEFP